MSYEFTKLSNVPVVSAFPEGANAVIETNGEIKRCPSSGGGGGIEFITLTQSGETYTANKNSEEIIALIDSGKLPMLIVPANGSGGTNISTVLYMFPIMSDGGAVDSTMDGFVFSAAGALGIAVVDSAGATTIRFEF